jgi:beta-lactam-binding protein with PASTA domain
MTERSATTDAGTVAWVFRNTEEAEAGARHVRLSEGAGTTTEAHVAENVGMTSSDFAATLETAGFGAHDARRLTEAIARGGALVTLAAGQEVERALAVLRGESVAAQSLAPVDVVPAGVARASVPATDAQTLELREEQLQIEKQRSYSEARIHRETVTEHRTITVPVQRERLVVERDGEEAVHIPISGDP